LKCLSVLVFIDCRSEQCKATNYDMVQVALQPTLKYTLIEADT